MRSDQHAHAVSEMPSPATAELRLRRQEWRKLQLAAITDESPVGQRFRLSSTSIKRNWQEAADA